jgi:hypothetical protein
MVLEGVVTNIVAFGAFMIMLAAETEAAGALRLSTYGLGLTVPNGKAASDERRRPRGRAT